MREILSEMLIGQNLQISLVTMSFLGYMMTSHITSDLQELCEYK